MNIRRFRTINFEPGAQVGEQQQPGGVHRFLSYDARIRSHHNTKRLCIWSPPKVGGGESSLLILLVLCLCGAESPLKR
jgi:hypothetical protein